MNASPADRMKGRDFRQTAAGENTLKVEIPLQAVPIDKREIALALGYSDRKLPPHFEDLIDEVIRRSPEFCALQAGYRVLDVEKTLGSRQYIQVGETQFHTRQLVSAQLKNAEKIVLFLCSIGSGMEEWSRESSGNGDPALGYFIDTTASVIVESAVDVLHRSLGDFFKLQGLNITNRYSPGYCDWPVDE
ncbi:MAG: hypothetical protein EHM64_11000, partial [Ignavibacteriae bacterium]